LLSHKKTDFKMKFSAAALTICLATAAAFTWVLEELMCCQLRCVENLELSWCPLSRILFQGDLARLSLSLSCYLLHTELII
jgi:hypothetical protein